MPRLPRSLNTRIVLVVSCILLVTGVTSGWVTARNQTEKLLVAMRLNAGVMTQNLAESCARYLLVRDYAELETFLLQSAALPDILRLQVCEPNGALLGEVADGPNGEPQTKTGLARLSPPTSPAPATRVEKDRLVIWQPITAGSLLGWIRADFSLATIHQTQAGTWENTLLLALAWVIGSAGLIILVLRPTVQSISRLTAFAAQLDACKGAQIAITGQPSEITELGASLNAVSRRLAAAERQLLEERERLRQSEAMYRSLVTAMAEGVVFQGADGTITAINPAAEAIEGRAAAQMLGRTSDDPLWQAIHEDGLPFPGKHHPAMVTLRSGEPQSDVVMGIYQPDRTLVWISVNCQPLTAPGEKKPYAVVTTFRDITEHKRAEEGLRRERALLRCIIDSADDLIFIKDRAGVYLGCNQASEAFLGLPEEAQIGKTDFDFFGWEMAGRVQEEDRQVLEVGKSLRTEEWVTYPDGRRVLLDTSKVPFRGPDGEIQGLVGICRDITQRKQDEEALQALNEELEGRVTERTAALEAKNHELERTIKLFVGRELRMVELKKRINDLEQVAMPKSLEETLE